MRLARIRRTEPKLDVVHNSGQMEAIFGLKGRLASGRNVDCDLGGRGTQAPVTHLGL